MQLIYTFIAALFLATNSFAAVWERPAGAYTPTNHSINTNKYQIDSANKTPISSVKVDGDINKAFQGLNDIETRTPPTVAGQSGKLLTNNGAVTIWTGVTGDISYSGGLFIIGDGAIDTAKIADGAVNAAKIAEEAVVLTSKVSGTLPAGNGGTGLNSFSAGDLIYATSATTLTKLPKGTALQTLRMNADATAPEWMSRNVVQAFSSGTTTISAVIPEDDTIPQNTEGQEHITASITPRSTSSRIRITVDVVGVMQSNNGGDVASRLVGAIFRGSQASAIHASQSGSNGYGRGPLNLSMTFIDTPSTTSATTYSLRLGKNGVNVATPFPLFGGVGNNVMTLEEIE